MIAEPAYEKAAQQPHLRGFKGVGRRQENQIDVPFCSVLGDHLGEPGRRSFGRGKMPTQRYPAPQRGHPNSHTTLYEQVLILPLVYLCQWIVLEELYCLTKAD